MTSSAWQRIASLTYQGFDPGRQVESIREWRRRIFDKLEAAAARQPATVEVDLPSLADQVFTVVEGGFILARALDDLDALRAQIAHLRTHLSLLFPEAE